ncbi:MAG: DNA methyltransferase [Thermodesulfobacteriota bacterium]
MIPIDLKEKNMLALEYQHKEHKSENRERARMEQKYGHLMKEELYLSNLVSYMGNRNIPLLRLYKYKEAFSFPFVRDFLRRLGITSNDYVFDPFAGMGTTLFASMLYGIPSIGVDKLPVATFVAETIPKFLSIRRGELTSALENLRNDVSMILPAPVAIDVPIMELAFNRETILRLRQWKAAIDRLESPLKEVFLLLFFAILEETSYTSKDGQFLRLIKDKKVSDPDEALSRKVSESEEDIARVKWFVQNINGSIDCLPKVFHGDATDLRDIPFDKPPTAVITSPPYANRYDYTRSYCLELCFHFVTCFEELKEIRFGIIRSHIESKVSDAEKPPHPVVGEVVECLSAKKLNNPRIPYMLTGYFIDMEKAINEWSRVLAPDAKVAMVVDNVRFEGELVPVDLVLTEIAEEAGFETKEIVISRYKGNSSQQMKKYGRVPVRESVVIWRKI